MLSPGTLKISINLRTSTCIGPDFSGVGMGGMPVSTRWMRSSVAADLLTALVALFEFAWLLQIDGARPIAADISKGSKRFSMAAILRRRNSTADNVYRLPSPRKATRFRYCPNFTSLPQALL